MKLCICFGICLSSRWFHLRLTWDDNSSTTSIHINCFMAGVWHTSCHPISKMHIVGEGPSETPSALSCPSYLINSFLTAMKLKDANLWQKSYDQYRQHIKKQKHYFANKGLSSQGCGFSSSHIWMWELDYKESSALKYWCFWTVLLEKTLEGPLDCKEIQPVHPKGDSPGCSLEGLMLKLKLH